MWATLSLSARPELKTKLQDLQLITNIDSYKTLTKNPVNPLEIEYDILLWA